MSNLKNLPAPSPEQGLNRYMQEIRKFPMLEPEEEYMLAKRWVDHEDTDAAHQMVTSHLRLAAKIAMGYRGYGLPQAEVISEADVVDPCIYSGICAAVVVYGQIGHHIGAKETVFQSAQGQEQDWCIRRR